jgi:predicted metalloprotease with PDZ domain
LRTPTKSSQANDSDRYPIILIRLFIFAKKKMRLLLPLVYLLLLNFIATAQNPITYQLDLSQIQHHELKVNITFHSLSPEPLVVRMPTASPGRYAEHNFAKNVYAVAAKDEKGQELTVSRTGLSEWTVAQHQGKVNFSYTLYANRADGTYAKVDNLKLHLNMPATFAYGVGMEKRPIELIIPPHQNWSVATQLQKAGANRYRAPNYYYFYDSPTMVGDIRFRRWTVASAARVDTIEIAFLTPDPDSLLDAYTEWTKKVVAEQQRVYGELPAYDYGRYTFLCAYNPYVSGDGMEHRNSTVCSASVPLATHKDRLIGTVSHEFFHCWNVERIRPASLEPFNFDKANLSGELWFAEGFTSYYDDLTLARTGIITPEAYASGISGILNYVLLRPGTHYRSPIGMSQCAPFVDAASSIDEDNFDNTFISYYSYGAVLGMALDLTLRRDHNTDLDELMRLIWQTYGRTEVPYYIPDLQAALAQLTGDSAFAEKWFAQHIYQSELPDLKGLLADFGIRATTIAPDTVGFYGLRLTEREAGLFVDGKVYANTSLYQAGLGEGDRLMSLNGKDIQTREDWDSAVGGLTLGQIYPIVFEKNGLTTTGQLIAGFDPSFGVNWLPEVDRKTARRRNAWLHQ